MPPYLGSIHRRPRSDSGAARLWDWAHRRRKPWSAETGADAAKISARRCREIVRALVDAGLIDIVSEATSIGEGREAATYALSAAGRGVRSAPVMIVDAEAGRIVGVRPGTLAAPANVRLRAAVEASGLSARAAARALGLNDRTLRRMLSGDLPIFADDPLFDRAIF